MPNGPNPWPDARWEVVPVGGIAIGGEETEALLVELSPDGRQLTAYFQGGNPSCYVATGVRVERRDPELPVAFVATALRFGITGCDAALYPLAVRVPLDPPFSR